ncbi:antibiotic biosynthesis monooxygenase family protein [Nocardia sp. NPDC052566]|uniref:antibiotic biosynthesis monooxygenase family protein n=1 Tax=Nocardia sp. NPDC052566 TaxID=3364330 RepID=UPI0037CB25D2
MTYIVIDATELPIPRIDEFVEQWRARAEIISTADGFREARLLRAVAPDAALPLVMVAHWDSREAKDTALKNPRLENSAAEYTQVHGGGYEIAAEYHSGTTADGSGVEFVNAFELPAERMDEFLAHWRGRAEVMVKAPGFHYNRMHRALDPQSRFQAVNVAHWASADEWRAAGANPAFQQRLAAAPPFFTANPALYDVAARFSPR